MKDLIAYCGLDCEKCEARIATMADDDELREKVAKKWSEMNNTYIVADMINCEGCRVSGRKSVFCDRLCEIRKCAMEQEMETCGDCAEIEGCEKIRMITDHNPTALENLQGEK